MQAVRRTDPTHRSSLLDIASGEPGWTSLWEDLPAATGDSDGDVAGAGLRC